MRRFVEGTDRGQSTLFPECLEDWIGEDNPVRVMDVFVDELDLGDVGFSGNRFTNEELTIEEGYATARAVALSMLSSLKQELGDLDRVKRVIRLYGMVNVAPGFDRMPEVIDGASDFFYDLFGPKFGQHARTAVGVAELPHGIPVEINGEFELET
jgi:enamine deaminase RidA (YjgF/YER057c/UK114 family)